MGSEMCIRDRTIRVHDNSTVGGHILSKAGHTHTIADITDIHYQTIRANGTGQTQRARLNFSTDFALTDESGNNQTTVALATSGVTAATYGSATTVPAVAVNASGQITSATDTPIDFDAAFPTQTSNGGKSLVTDGSATAWVQPITAPAYGSAASPATANTGHLVLPGTGFGVRRSTGSAYESFGPLVKFNVPNFGSFSWVNQGGSATASSSLGGIQIDTVAAEAAENVRLMQAALSSAPWKITAAFYPFLESGQNSECGILLRNNGDSKIVTFGATFGAGSALQVNGTKWTDESTPASTYFTNSFALLSMPVWFQIEDDGADRIFRISMNGVHWFDVHTVTNSDFLTSRTHYGYYVSSRADSSRAAMSLMSLVVV